MIRERDIAWFLQDPMRLLQMKPFTRGGEMASHGFEGENILNNTDIYTGFANLELTPISQDTYITEYRPDLHHIILNQSIPKIKVKLNGREFPTKMLQITQTASFQKLIHAAHVRNLTANPLVLNLCNKAVDTEEAKMFAEVKQEWLMRDCEWYKYKAISTCKKLGNCATLFSFDTNTGRYSITNFSYEDGYQIIPNYDEYGIEIARSIAYQLDDKIVIEVYDNALHYRCIQKDKGWVITHERHGFSRNPLVINRGKVAWEYAESSIEMWEILKNIAAVTLKRFGTFALAFWGEMDKDSIQRDSSTLIVNLSSDTTNGKQDVKVLDFKEPQTMEACIESLERDISLFSSTSFITPKDISTTGSGGNGIALAMSNDYALATQSALDWQKYMNDMVYLHQEGLDLENGGDPKYSKLRISAKIAPWSLETNNTKIVNLQMESKWLSTRTIIERSPDAAPDEEQRIIEERGSLVPADYNESDVEKAQRIAENKSNEIIDNQ